MPSPTRVRTTVDIAWTVGAPVEEATLFLAAGSPAVVAAAGLTVTDLDVASRRVTASAAHISGAATGASEPPEPSASRTPDDASDNTPGEAARIAGALGATDSTRAAAGGYQRIWGPDAASTDRKRPDELGTAGLGSAQSGIGGELAGVRPASGVRIGALSDGAGRESLRRCSSRPVSAGPPADLGESPDRLRAVRGGLPGRDAPGAADASDDVSAEGPDILGARGAAGRRALVASRVAELSEVSGESARATPAPAETAVPRATVQPSHA